MKPNMKLCTSVLYHFLLLCLGFAETTCHDCVDSSLLQLTVKDTVLGAVQGVQGVQDVPIHDETSVFKFPLPKTLEVLSPSDPSFAKLQESAEKYALNIEPGKGGIVDYVIVKNKEPMHFMRVWGGSASQCGYWWTLPKTLAVAPNGQITLAGFMSELGVCPEWNNGTFLEICEGELMLKLRVPIYSLCLDLGLCPNRLHAAHFLFIFECTFWDHCFNHGASKK